MANSQVLSFGAFIKQKREELMWTQTELGAKIGINSTAISRIENNNKTLSASKLSLLSKIFKVELNKIKELYYGDKFAKEAYKNNCPESVFTVAADTVKYLKASSK